MKRKTTLVVAGVVLASLTITVRAAAPVADIASMPGASRAAPSVAASPSTETYYLLQSLRDELRVLRGMVEEQSNSIRLLKQRQVDDYLDLDRRLGSLAKGSLAKGSAGRAPGQSTASAVNIAPVAAAALPQVSDSAEKAAYEQAYGTLKAGKVAAAKGAFSAYLDKYPQGRYAANGHYWLGEIYMLDNQLDKAGKAFAIVVEQYPAHRKMLDASFKLGKVYHLQGKDKQARALLSKVAATKGSAGRLAGDYLKANL